VEIEGNAEQKYFPAWVSEIDAALDYLVERHDKTGRKEWRPRLKGRLNPLRIVESSSGPHNAIQIHGTASPAASERALSFPRTSTAETE
jgi:hypothetical protein